MQNPELTSFSQTIPVDLMYKYETGQNIKWGPKQYKSPRQYLDPLNQVLQRKYNEQKKGEKDKKYVTRRGFYMNYDLKVAKGIPSAFDHGKNQPWNMDQFKTISKHRKVDQKITKNTYLDQIQINQTKRPSPGISKYSLEKSLKQKEKELESLKKIKKMEEERRFFHQDIEHVSNGIPGSGNYSPHDQIITIQKNKTDWKFWVDKHKKFSQLIKKRDEMKPGSCTYNPLNTTFSTFDQICTSPKNKNKVNGFGTEGRFSYNKVEKIKIKQVRPSPNSYKTAWEWRGKSESPKFKPWNTAVWKGKNFSTISVYD